MGCKDRERVLSFGFLISGHQTLQRDRRVTKSLTYSARRSSEKRPRSIAFASANFAQLLEQDKAPKECNCGPRAQSQPKPRYVTSAV